LRMLKATANALSVAGSRSPIFAAWVRTAIGIIAFGFLVGKFDLFLQFAAPFWHETVTCKATWSGSPVTLTPRDAGLAESASSLLRVSPGEIERGPHNTRPRLYFAASQNQERYNWRNYCDDLIFSARTMHT